MQAETLLVINGGSGSITTGNGASSALKIQSDAQMPPQQQKTSASKAVEPTANTATDAAASENSADSFKGMKAGAQLAFHDGEYAFDCEDDALHTNGDLIFENGNTSISTGDDAFHADNILQISGGVITVTASYEGLEGSQIDVSGGTIAVNASDDGINAAGGNDGSGAAGKMSADQFSESGNHSIAISGGSIYVNAQGDGIDSNGAIFITGGSVIVDGPESSGNGAMDYDTTCAVDGGTLIAAGSAGMAQNISDSSKQAAVLISYDQQGSDRVTFMQEDKMIFSYQPSKSYQTILISAPYIKQGETYTLLSGGTLTEETEDHTVTTTGSLKDGQTLSQITLSDLVNTLSQNGEKTELQTFGGGHGGMNRGDGNASKNFNNGQKPTGTPPQAPGQQPQQNEDAKSQATPK